MPAEAGIQVVGENNNFKYLHSRFRGNDNIFPIATQPPRGEGRIGVIFAPSPPPLPRDGGEGQGEGDL